ncbi:MAG: hypothetical protein PVI78_03725 [Anaerolineales bacterium]|jgi:hypothetical protein
MINRRAFSIIAFPILLTLGIILIPIVSDYSDHAVAAEAAEQTGRWLAGHLVSAAAFAWSVWSVSEIEAEIRRRSTLHSPVRLILISLGAGLFAAGLGADGIAPVALRTSGTSPLAFFDGGMWVTMVFIIGTTSFGVGLISLAINAIQNNLVTGVWRFVVFASTLLFVTMPAVPSGYGLYGEALASFGVFLPLGLSIARSK